MIDFSSFFQLGNLPSDAMHGTYHRGLVALSYVIAVFASYVALDFVGRLRTEKNYRIKRYWLIGGAFAMGAGIWSMHFIGMLAFIMPMPMSYIPFWTGLSLLVAILSSAFAMFLLRNEETSKIYLVFGGVVLGFGIAAMHYTGMAGMADTTIRYLPDLFILSIIIAIAASEAALWLIIRSNTGSFSRQVRLKIGSALVMGVAICGMHYTGMAAAVFIPHSTMHFTPLFYIQPVALALYITVVTGVILTIALLVSTYKQLLESASQNEKDFLSAVLNNLSNGVMACNSKGKITVLNPALQTLLKLKTLPKSETWSEYFSMHLPNDPTEIPISEYPIFRALRGEKIESLEVEMILKKYQKKRNLILNGQPLLNIHGENLGAVITVEDITESKLAEEKLIGLQKQLVAAARQAGMGDIATSVVHNVGNVLNSVNVSIAMLRESIKTSAVLKLSDLVSKLLKEHPDDLGEFISKDSRGAQFPRYLQLLAETLLGENLKILQEVNDLEKSIAHISNIVSAQKSLTSTLGVLEEAIVPEIIEDAITMSIESQYLERIKIVRQFKTIKPVTTDKIKLLQILCNILKNSLDALINTDSTDKKINIAIAEKDNRSFMVQVTDNGIGIPPEDLNKIFAYGYTTKEGGHGFGLHSSANFATEMGGTLYAESNGLGTGATLTLVLPYKANRS